MKTLFKKSTAMLLPLLGAWQLAGADPVISHYEGMPGQAPQKPQLALVDAPAGKAVQAQAVAAGRYQGLTYNLPEIIDLEGIESIEFDWYQTAWHKDGVGMLLLQYADRKECKLDVASKSGKWHHVIIKLNDDQRGKLKRMAFGMYATMDAPGEKLAVANIKFNKRVLKAAPGVTVDEKYMDTALWKGNTGGNAPQTPEIALIDSVRGKAVQVKAISQGPYQGMNLALPELVDTAAVGAIEFDFFQTAYHNNGTAQVLLNYDNGNGMNLPFQFKKSGWTHVTIPIDLRTIKMQRPGTPVHGNARELVFTIYRALDLPGETFAVANLRFVSKQQGSAPIAVKSYRYLSAKPNSGEKSGSTLTDGVVDEKSQIHYDWYSEDPYIEFDLGALYLVDKLELSGIAVPSQNIASITVETSSDGKKFRAAANIENKDGSAEKKLFKIGSEDLALLGRYIRIRGYRSRTDFPIDISEVAFSGKLPSDEELRAAAASTYNLGPDMPEVSAKDYYLYKNDAGSFAIFKKNGILRKLTVDGVVIADRMLGRYDMSDGKKQILTDDYSAQLIDCKTLADGVEVTFKVNKLDNITFKRFYGWVDGVFTTRLAFDSARTDRQILQSSCEVILPQAIRTGGRYETWGAGHSFEHKQADDLTMEMPADTGPVVSFESPKQNLTFLNFRYRYSDRYVQIGSGTVTVVGYGDKRTKFTDNGWVLGDGLFAVNDQNRTGSIETRLIVVKGDLVQAFDQYLALPETKKFRSAIKRPSWAKDIRSNASGGAWQNMYGENALQNAIFYNNMIREGVIVNVQLNGVFTWGDWNKPLKTKIYRNQFGGELTLEEHQQLMRDIHTRAPKTKITEYTWMWSASANSDIFKAHPEWFIVKNATGATVSFFPGAPNHYRLYGRPGSPSFENAYQTLTEHINGNNFDFWYLDGGGSPSAIDWARLIIEEPDTYDTLYKAVRDNIQQHGDRGMFFNHPENPLAEIGYLEGSASAIFSDANWRDGAGWMYKFKLWQRPDALFNPAFIYWRGPAEESLKAYVTGTGLFPCIGESDRNILTYTKYISMHNQTRWAKLVSANFEPNWRNDPECKWELMPLTFGKHGHLMVRNRHAVEAAGEFSCDMAPLGVDNAQLPVYTYIFTQIPSNGAIPEGEAEAAYRTTGWQSDFLLKGEFTGTQAWNKRLTQKLNVPASGMKLIYVTQSPALVWSVDDLRNQYPMSATLGVEVAGKTTDSSIVLTANSDRRTAELIANLPAGTVVETLTVNGKNTDFVPMHIMNSNFARFAIPQGASSIVIKVKPAVSAPAGSYALSVKPAQPGEKLQFALNTPPINSKLAGSMNIFAENGAVVWNGAFDLSGSKSQLALQLPDVMTGGTFTAQVYDPAGKVLAETTFKVNNAPAKLKQWVYRMPPVEGNVKEFAPVKTSAGTTVKAQATQYSRGDGQAIFDPANAAVTLKVAPRTYTTWNVLAGAMLNSNLKRYVKVRIEGNHEDFAGSVVGSGIRNVSPCYGDSPSCAAITFDFETPNGFTHRSFTSVGIIFANRSTPTPDNFGTKRVPDHISALSGFCQGKSGRVEEHYLDLNDLGVPADWTGTAWVGLCFQNSTPNRVLKLTVLGTYDRLPAGAKASNIAVMKGKVNTAAVENLKVPKLEGKLVIDGKPDEKAWAKALKLTGFTMVNAPSTMAPPSAIKLLTDGKLLYVAVEFFEPAEINANPEAGRAWQTDGLEFYLARGKKHEEFDQYVFGSNGLCYAARTWPGKPVKMHPTPEWKCVIKDKTIFMEAAIPLKYADSDMDISGFNAGRNRTGAQSGNYSLTPGNGYRVFSKYNLIFE